MATCQHCGQTFANALQLGAHTRTHRHEGAEDEDENEAEDENLENDSYVITAPAPLFELARRPPGSCWGREEVVQEQQEVQNPPALARDYREVCFFPYRLI